MTPPLYLQENIIREFNLNELYQKSKKMSKGKAEKVAEPKFPAVPEEGELEAGPNGQDVVPETKKDK